MQPPRRLLPEMLSTRCRLPEMQWTRPRLQEEAKAEDAAGVAAARPAMPARTILACAFRVAESWRLLAGQLDARSVLSRDDLRGSTLSAVLSSNAGSSIEKNVRRFCRPAEATRSGAQRYGVVADA